MNNCKLLLYLFLVSCSVNDQSSHDRVFQFKHVTQHLFTGSPSFYLDRLNEADKTSGFSHENNYAGIVRIFHLERQLDINFTYLGTWENFDIVYCSENGGGSGYFTSLSLRHTDGDRKKSRTIFGGDRSDDGVYYAFFDGFSKIYFKSHMSIETIAKQCNLSKNIADWLRRSSDFSTCMACGWHEVTYSYDLNKDELDILSLIIQPSEAPIGFRNFLEKLFPCDGSSVITGTNIKIFFQELKEELNKSFNQSNY